MGQKETSGINLEFTSTGGKEMLQMMDTIVSSGAKVEKTFTGIYDAAGKPIMRFTEVQAKGKEVARALDTITDSSKKTEKSFLDLDMPIGNLILRMAGVYSASSALVKIGSAIIETFKEQIKTAISLSATYEAARLSWGGLMGDMEKGSAIFDDIRISTMAWPTSFESVEKASIRLKGFGIEGENIKGILSQLGDAARGQGDELGRLALVYGQTFAQGKANARDLYQFIDAGVPIIQGLAEAMGREPGEILERMKTGDIKIAFKDIETAIRTMTSEGGLFYEQMKLFSESAQGQWSLAVKSWKNELAEIGNTLLPFLTKQLKEFNGILSGISGMRQVDVVIETAGKKGDPVAAYNALHDKMGRERISTVGYENSQLYQQDNKKLNIIKQYLPKNMYIDGITGELKTREEPPKPPTPKLSGWQVEVGDATGMVIKPEDTVDTITKRFTQGLKDDEAWSKLSFGMSTEDIAGDTAVKIKKILTSLKGTMYDKDLKPFVTVLQGLYKTKKAQSDSDKKTPWQSLLGGSTGIDFTEVDQMTGLKQWGTGLIASRDEMQTLGADVNTEYNNKIKNLIEKMLTSGQWTAKAEVITYLENLLEKFPITDKTSMSRLVTEASNIQDLLNSLPQSELSLWDTEIPFKSDRANAQTMANLKSRNDYTQALLSDLDQSKPSLWDTETPEGQKKVFAKQLEDDAKLNKAEVLSETEQINTLLASLPQYELSLWDTEIPIQSAKAAAKNLAELLADASAVQTELDLLPKTELSLWDTEIPIQSEKAAAKNLATLLEENNAIQDELNKLPSTELSLWDTEIPIQSAKAAAKNLARIVAENAAIQAELDQLPQYELSLWDTETPFQSNKSNAKNLRDLQSEADYTQTLLSDLDQTKPSLWDTETPEGQKKIFDKQIADDAKLNKAEVLSEAEQIQTLLDSLPQYELSLWDTEIPIQSEKVAAQNLATLLRENETVQAELDQLPKTELSLWDTEIPVQSAKAAAKNLSNLIAANAAIQAELDQLPQYELSLWDTEVPFPSAKANARTMSDLEGGNAYTQALLNDLDQNKPSLWDTEVPGAKDRVRAVTDSEKLALGIKKLKEELDSGKISVEGYDKELENLRKQYDPLTGAIYKFKEAAIDAAGSLMLTTMHDLGETLAGNKNGFDSLGAAAASAASSLLNQIPMLMLTAGLNVLSSPGGWANPLAYALIVGSGLVAMGVGAADYALKGGSNSVTAPTADTIAANHYAKGTLDSEGGWAITGEDGPELQWMQKGSIVIPNKMTRALLSAGVPGFASGLNVGALTLPSSSQKLEVNNYNQVPDVEVTTKEETRIDGTRVINQYITKRVKAMSKSGEIAKSMGLPTQGRAISRG